jgi:hypothetical protein
MLFAMETGIQNDLPVSNEQEAPVATGAAVPDKTEETPTDEKTEVTPADKPVVTNDTAERSRLNEAFNQAKEVSEAIRQFKKRLHKYTASGKNEWPEERGHTEHCILQLKEKQVLFIRGVASDWFDKVPQRIASVLQTSLNRLWPGCEGVCRLKADEKLPFNFWKTFDESDKFDKPVIIVIPRGSTSEYLRNFALADWDKAYYDYKAVLKAINIFLIIQVPDDENEEVLKQAESNNSLKQLYAFYTVPAIKLELRRNRGHEGNVLYKKIKEEFGLQQGCDRQIFGIIQEDPSGRDEAVMDVIRTEIRTRNFETELIEKSLNEKTELKLCFIFCGAFFNEVTYADFIKMAGCLLQNKMGEERYENGKRLEPLSLNEIWTNSLEVRKVLTECMLVTKVMEGVKSIGFTRKVSPNLVRNAFLQNEYYIFLSLSNELIANDILFEKGLSDRLYNSLVRVFSTVIKDNYTTYDGSWLLEKATQQVNKLYRQIPDEETRRLLQIGEKILDFSLLKSMLEPLIGLLKELLLSGREELTNIVKSFFEQLIDTRLEKRVALGLAIDLYKELHNEGNFPEAELDRYFNRALNEGTLADKFDVYRLMVRNIYYRDLHNKTNRWLADESISAGSWTKKFAWLYKVDYYIVSFYLYFKPSKEEKKYELLTSPVENGQPGELGTVIKALTSKQCLYAWKYLFDAYTDQFEYTSKHLERAVTNIEALAGRNEENNRNTLSLSGDIFENWFYILWKERESETSAQMISMQAFAMLLKENVETAMLDALLEYWSHKTRQTYLDTTIFYMHDSDREDYEKIIETIDNRSCSLEQLLEIIRNLK